MEESVRSWRHVRTEHSLTDPPLPCSGIIGLTMVKTYGLSHVALRLTSWDQRGQLARFLAEVAPAFA